MPMPIRSHGRILLRFKSEPDWRRRPSRLGKNRRVKKLSREGAAVDSGVVHAAHLYHQAVLETLERVWNSQSPVLEQAADWLADALVDNHLIYLFGTGHSHLLALELFYRAGGLVHVAPILEEPLMLHESASLSSERERESGYAERVLARYPIAAGDILVVASNSGRNAVPIEMVLSARGRGLRTIALTSLTHSRSVTSRHPSGLRLFEVADLVIDNGSVTGDAAVSVPGVAIPMGPTSTVVGSFLMNALSVEAAARAAKRGWKPEVFSSANAGGSESNTGLLERFRGRVHHL